MVMAISVPMAFASLSTPLLGIVDTAVVGQFGNATLIGGLAIGSTVFGFVFASFNFLRSGTSGLVAQAFGQDNIGEQQAVFWRAIIIALVLSILLIAASQLIKGAGVLFMQPPPNLAEAIGVTVLPTLSRLQGNENLRFLPIADRNAKRTVYLLTHADRSLSPAAQHFATIVKAVIAETSLARGVSTLLQD